MSRSIRRTDLSAFECYIFRENDPRWRRVFKNDMTYRQYVRKARALFHSDSRCRWFGTKAPLPHWVRNALQERPFRRAVKAQIVLCGRRDEMDAIVAHRPPKDAWLYY